MIKIEKEHIKEFHLIWKNRSILFELKAIPWIKVLILWKPNLIDSWLYKIVLSVARKNLDSLKIKKLVDYWAI